MAQVATLRDFHVADGEAHYRRLRDLLAGHDLWKTHDAIGLGIVHDMATSGSPLIPRVAGMPWLFDPPLYHWLAAGFGSAFQLVTDKVALMMTGTYQSLEAPRPSASCTVDMALRSERIVVAIDQ